MTITPDQAALLPLTTDDALCERVEDLIGVALRREVWLLFLDADDIQLPIVVPVENLPEWPDDLTGFVSAVADCAGLEGASSVVAVWERPGDSRPSDADRAWARDFALAFARTDYALRGQLLSHDHGVRWFAADDYL
jgi:hypothetical protein